MTSLKPRQERFCRLFVECANAAQAARGAGYQPEYARNTGHRLLKQPRIMQRISELQTIVADGQCRDVDVLLTKLETVYRRAIDDHQLSAATRAVELQARLGGVGSASRTTGVSKRRRPDTGNDPAPGPEDEDDASA
jgi:Phage terminase, small subunit